MGHNQKSVPLFVGWQVDNSGGEAHRITRRQHDQAITYARPNAFFTSGVIR